MPQFDVFSFSTQIFWFLFTDFVFLGWIGQNPVEEPFVELGQIATVFYFIYFIFFIPLLGWVEQTLLRH